MWISVFTWFLAIFSISIWIGTYIVYDKHRFFSWFDNKFGKDDPMPPSPKQQSDALNLGEGTSLTFNKPTTSEQEET